MNGTAKKNHEEATPAFHIVQDDIQKVAFMDLDGTIVDSNCLYYLNLIHKDLNSKTKHFIFTLLLRITGIFLFYFLNKISSITFDKLYCQYYKGMKAINVNKAVENKVLPFIKTKIFPEAEEEINKLKREGYHIVLVSASLKNIVQPMVDELNVHDFISTEFEVEDGVFTGKVIGGFVNNLNKQKVIEEYCQQNNVSLDNTIAYGNSRWDIPMLQVVGEANIVNPDKKLNQWFNNNSSIKKTWRFSEIPFLYYVISILFLPYLRKYEGLQHLPKNKGAILIANHASYLDHYVIGVVVSLYCRRRIRPLAKKEHFETPFQRWLHKFLGAVPIDRDKGGKEGLKTIIDLLKNNEIVLVYPEGTRSRDGLMKKFKPGVLHTHFKSGCDIIPVGINGAYQVLPSGNFLPRFARISIKFGAPLSFLYNETVPRGDEREQILYGLRKTVKNLAKGVHPI